MSCNIYVINISLRDYYFEWSSKYSQGHINFENILIHNVYTEKILWYKYILFYNTYYKARIFNNINYILFSTVKIINYVFVLLFVNNYALVCA